MKEIFLQISNRQDLSQDQVQAVFDRILKNEVSESQIAAFLMGLKTKGETADEITGIVRFDYCLFCSSSRWYSYGQGW